MVELNLNHIHKKYPNATHYAVEDFNLNIKDKEFIVFVGPSGCGKSTTLRMVAGLEDITEGQLKIDGEVVNDKSPKDRDIAMVFQSYALYPHMTVAGNMAFGIQIKKVPVLKTDENGRAKFVSVLCLNDALKPVMTEIQNGMKIECGGAVVYINILSDGRIMHRNCIAAFDGITTDAVALVIRDGRYGVVNGSIVRRDDVSFLDTIERVNGWVDGKTPEWLL